VHGGIFGLGVLLDGVALVGFDGDFALFLDFGDGAAGLAAAPVPGDCGLFTCQSIIIVNGNCFLAVFMRTRLAAHCW
jgi:hypothetical protein